MSLSARRSRIASLLHNFQILDNVYFGGYEPRNHKIASIKSNNNLVIHFRRKCSEFKQGFRSAFTPSGLWRKLYDCSRHKFRARKCLIKRDHFHFRQSPTFWMQFERRLFDAPLWELEDTWGSGLAHSLTVVELFGWFQEGFRPSFV